MEHHLSEIQLYELNRNLKVILNDFEVIKIDKNLPAEVSKKNHKLFMFFFQLNKLRAVLKRLFLTIEIQL